MALDYDTAVRETAEMLGEQAYHNALGGVMSDWQGVDFHGAAAVLAIVYDVNTARIVKDLVEIAEEKHENLFAENVEVVGIGHGIEIAEEGGFKFS